MEGNKIRGTRSKRLTVEQMERRIKSLEKENEILKKFEHFVKRKKK